MQSKIEIYHANATQCEARAQEMPPTRKLASLASKVTEAVVEGPPKKSRQSLVGWPYIPRTLRREFVVLAENWHRDTFTLRNANPCCDRIRQNEKAAAVERQLCERVPAKASVALGQTQTFALQKAMSALPPKADMCGAARDVRFGPIADIPPKYYLRWYSTLYCVRA
jgi:hypothetical protein